MITYTFLGNDRISAFDADIQQRMKDALRKIIFTDQEFRFLFASYNYFEYIAFSELRELIKEYPEKAITLTFIEPIEPTEDEHKNKLSELEIKPEDGIARLSALRKEHNTGERSCVLYCIKHASCLITCIYPGIVDSPLFLYKYAIRNSIRNNQPAKIINIISDETIQILENTIKDLPEHNRSLMMDFFNGLELAEVMKQHNITKNGVLERARRVSVRMAQTINRTIRPLPKGPPNTLNDLFEGKTPKMTICTFLGHGMIHDYDLRERLEAALEEIISRDNAFLFLLVGANAFEAEAWAALQNMKSNYPDKFIKTVMVSGSRRISKKKYRSDCYDFFISPFSDCYFTPTLAKVNRTFLWCADQSKYLIMYYYPYFYDCRERYQRSANIDGLNTIDISSQETRADIEEMVNQLGYPYDKIIIYKSMGMTNKMIAETMEISVSKVQTLYSKVRNIIQNRHSRKIGLKPCDRMLNQEWIDDPGMWRENDLR